MIEITARRHYFPDHTYAVWYDSKDLPIGIKSIERPWLNNQSQVSCIPEGTYTCNPFHSPSKVPSDVYLVAGTAPREMIEIHVANFASQLLGCIAPGLDFVVMQNKGGKLEAAVASSAAALARLKAYTNYEPFQLTITGDNL